MPGPMISQSHMPSANPYDRRGGQVAWVGAFRVVSDRLILWWFTAYIVNQAEVVARCSVTWLLT